MLTISERLMLYPYFGSTYTKTKIVNSIILVFILILFITMLKLGFWQLSRAEQKLTWQQTLTKRMTQNPLDFNQLNDLVLKNNKKNNDIFNLTGYQFSFQASPIQGRLLMLDNQIYQGQVGYLVFQPLLVEPLSSWILLELGFVKGLPTRNNLPAVSELTQKQVFTGKIYQKQINPLSEQLMPEFTWPKRIQNLNFAALEYEFGHHLLPIILQPDNVKNNLPHPWLPIPMPAEKHLGYALQWFSMATALFLLTSLLIFKHYYHSPQNNNNWENKTDKDDNHADK